VLSRLADYWRAFAGAVGDFLVRQDSQISSALSAGDLLQAELLLIGAVFVIPPLVAEGQLRAKDMLLYYRPSLPLVGGVLVVPWTVAGSFILAAASLLWMTFLLGSQLFSWRVRESTALEILKGGKSRLSPSLRYLQEAALEILKTPPSEQQGASRTLKLAGTAKPGGASPRSAELQEKRNNFALVQQQLAKARQELGRSARKVGTAERKLLDMQDSSESSAVISAAKQEIKDLEQVVREKQEALASLQKMEQRLENELWSLESSTIYFSSGTSETDDENPP
jgi:hypothetical protein